MKNKHFAIIIWCVVAVIFVGGFWFISIKNLSSDKTDEEYDPKNNSEYRDLTAICSHVPENVSEAGSLLCMQLRALKGHRIL